MSIPFSGLFWFLVMLMPLVFLQRFLHREIQAVILITTRSPQLTVGVFSVLFFPGVFLHEVSHFLMAKLLGVRAESFSLIPTALPNGRLQMGYVETEEVDVFRDSLIGLAPLITGSLFVAFAGLNRLGLGTLLDVLANGQAELFWLGIKFLPRVNDFYLWFYLVFTVSSTMMPSESDRHAWLPLGLWVAVLLGLGVAAGAGGWMLKNLAPLMDDFLSVLSTLFGLSAALHVVFLLPTFVVHRFVARISGVDVK